MNKKEYTKLIEENVIDDDAKKEFYKYRKEWVTWFSVVYVSFIFCSVLLIMAVADDNVVTKEYYDKQTQEYNDYVASLSRELCEQNDLGSHMHTERYTSSDIIINCEFGDVRIKHG